jgi:hypothetical protein
MEVSELAESYASRFSLSLKQGCRVEDFLYVAELIVLENKGYFIFKVDGERDRNIYTFALNMSEGNGVVLRRDTDSIYDGMEYIFSQLEIHEIYPK